MGEGGGLKKKSLSLMNNPALNSTVCSGRWKRGGLARGPSPPGCRCAGAPWRCTPTSGRWGCASHTAPPHTPPSWAARRSASTDAARAGQESLAGRWTCHVGLEGVVGPPSTVQGKIPSPAQEHLDLKSGAAGKVGGSMQGFRDSWSALTAPPAPPRAWGVAHYPSRKPARWKGACSVRNGCGWREPEKDGWEDRRGSGRLLLTWGGGVVAVTTQ